MDTQQPITASISPTGLTTDQARERLRQFGPNRVEEERRHPLLSFFAKFWAPVPWMLEATILLEILAHKLDEAIIIGVLLLFNSVLSFVQENQANRALTLLRNRLSVHARVLRDGSWQLIPAEQLVPGDVIHLRLGDLAPADVHLFDGVVEGASLIPCWFQDGAVNVNPDAGGRVFRALNELQRSKALVCVLHCCPSSGRVLKSRLTKRGVGCRSGRLNTHF